MDNKTALRIANDFIQDMNPNTWDGKGNINPEQIHLDTRIWEERNVFNNVALWINFEPPEENDCKNRWHTYIELRDNPDKDDPPCLGSWTVYKINSPQNIADGIMKICEEFNKQNQYFKEGMNMTKEQEKIRDSWLQILAILKEHGYDYLYQEDIARVANVIRKELRLDK